MMDGIVELARMFKDRDNPSVQGIGTGEVTAPPPGIAVMFNGFLLDEEMLVVAEHLTPIVGDAVIVVPSTDNQKYFIVGKVG